MVHEEVERDPIGQRVLGGQREVACGEGGMGHAGRRGELMEQVPGAGRNGWVQEHRSLRTKLAGIFKQSS